MSELEKYEAINATESIRELITVLKTIDDVKSRNPQIVAVSGEYWSNRLNGINTSLVEGTYWQDLRWTLLTRTYGIRQHAMMLAYYDYQLKQ